VASSRALLAGMYEAAVAGAVPETATRHAVAELDLPAAAAVHIIAIGKAAHAMAAGAVAALAATGREPAGGVIVGPTPMAAPHPALRVVTGDHPVPGPGSAAAAAAIGAAVAAVGPSDHALALISGGGTSLSAAPAADALALGVTQDDLGQLYALLLASGADVVAMNDIRKRYCRWFAGRLAAALAPAPVQALIVSDVLGDALASISSGPCVPDPLTARDVERLLRRHGVWDALPASARRYLDGVTAGEAPETPKPGDPVFEAVRTAVIVSNRHAVEAAAAYARDHGIDDVTVVPTPLIGEAAICGVRMASELIARRKRQRGVPRRTQCVLWGGETTVTLGPTPGSGGRNQELALAAARSLHDAGEQATGITLLAAGTDGRDGPTDAAGAVVDGLTWLTITGAGRDPDADLAAHDAYHALDAARTLIRVGHTGTNVMDIVIGLIM
jgi:hydroxypyruvate reductase